MRVLAAMSGGVDSAVAAARAVDAGHDVTGVHLALSKNPQSYRSGARGCCSKEDAHDARRAADVLGIPFYVWDLADRFQADVVDDFVAEYAAGRTPNPCLRCNEKIKFSAVLDRAVALGFDAVCTGHYARLHRSDAGVELHRAVDAAKDQSYVLGVLTAAQLSRSFFPLGTSVKSDVRAEAESRHLSVAAKPDSHDICFIPDGDTAGFLDSHLGSSPGEIVDASGRKVGEHAGSHRFTVGQRRGLRLGIPADDGQPRYVLDISPVTNTVTVGPHEALAVRGITAERPSWTQQPLAAGWRGLVQVRAHGAALPAHVQPGDPVQVVLDQPGSGIAPGQTVVLYDGDRVVGSATIRGDPAVTEDFEPVYSTGVGSWPGTDIDGALRITFAECPDLPYLPELPARGAHAQLVGRGTALLAGLAVDLQPAGWRLTDGSGREHRLAKATMRSDLDALEEAAQGYAGPFKFAFAGPWTLAAMMERPRGDRVLADSGARRDLGQSLTEGIVQLVAEMRRRLPDLRPIVQLDEPALPSVFAGAVPTASGFSRHRAVDENELGEAFSQIVGALDDADTGAVVVVHCCSAGVPITLLHNAGVRGIALDLEELTVPDWDAVGVAMEDGLWLGAGALPTDKFLTAKQVADRVLRPVLALGMEPGVAAHLLVTPACGLAGATEADAVRRLRTIRTAAEIVTDELAK